MERFQYIKQFYLLLFIVHLRLTHSSCQIYFLSDLLLSSDKIIIVDDFKLHVDTDSLNKALI